MRVLRRLRPALAVLLVLTVTSVMGVMVGFVPGALAEDAAALAGTPPVLSSDQLAGDIRGRTLWSLSMVLLLLAASLAGGRIVGELAEAVRSGAAGRQLFRLAFGGAPVLGGAMLALAKFDVSYTGAVGAQLLARIHLQVPLPVSLLQDGVIVALSMLVYLLAFAFSVPALSVAADNDGAAPRRAGAMTLARRRCRGLLWAGAALLGAAVLEFTTLFGWAARTFVAGSDAHDMALALAASHSLANGVVMSVLLLSVYVASQQTLALGEARDATGAREWIGPGIASLTPLFASLLAAAVAW
jgi:hypothetical protein